MASWDLSGWWKWKQHHHKQELRKKRLKRLFRRPIVQRLEDRLAPDGIATGALLANGGFFYPDDTDAWARPKASLARPTLSAAGDGAVTALSISGLPLTSRTKTSAATSGVTNPSSDSSDAGQSSSVTAPAFQSPLDVNLFATLDGAFAGESPGAPGVGPGDGGSLASLELYAALGSEGTMEAWPALGLDKGASSPAPLPSPPSAGLPVSSSPQQAQAAANSAATKPLPFTLTPSGNSPMLHPPGSGGGTPTTPTNPLAPLAPTVVVVSPPVLESVQAFGPAGHERLFVQGHVLHTAALGTDVTLDFYARCPSQADELLGSRVVTQTVAGRIDFSVNLEANMPQGTVFAAAVHGQGKGPDWTQGAWLPDGHGRPGYLHNTPPAVVTVPDGAPGQTLSLFSPGHTLENVQVLHPPGLDQSLPMGLVGFSVTGVPVGGMALVQMTLPVGMTASNYYKTDPASGQITPFDFDGRTGAQIHGNVITLHLRDGGPGDADGLANGVIVDPGGPGIPILKHTVIVPAATTAELVTLQSPVYDFGTVQTLDPPTTGASLPLGLFSFNVIGAVPGAAATVTMTLPDDVFASRYIKQDPLTGLLTQFDYDGQTGATIDGHTITLHLVDGGRGDADGLPDGIITDPGGPGGSTLTIPVSEGLGQGSGWTVFNTGGSGGSQGTVTYSNPNTSFTITEGNSFNVGLQHLLTIPSSPGILTFDYSNLVFDASTPGVMNDAFEAAFVDATGKSLVPTIGPGRNAFLNVTAGMNPALATGVTLQGGTVNLDISQLFAGTTGTIVFRIVNNDGTGTSAVTITGIPGPAVTENLANDTAPSGPGTDAYHHDLLSTDPTVTGTASDAAGITKLEAAVDGGAYSDITSSLNINQYTWYPGALAYGSHTILIRATDTNQVQTTASLTFTVDMPPTANAGGNQTVNQGDLVSFDGSNSVSNDGSPLYSYVWTFPDNSTASGTYATHTFVQAGSYPVPLTVTDIAGATATDTATITVNNLPAVVTGLADQVVAEAATASLLASFSDRGVQDAHTAMIDWGDGSTSAGIVSETNGSGTVSGSHAYAEEGTYTATVTVTDNGGAAGSASCTIMVNDAAPTLTLSGASAVNEGTAYGVTLGATVGPDPLSGWTIHWGDGATDTLPGTATSASHTYGDGPQQYTITASGTTDDGTVNASPLVVTVNNIPPTVSISGASSVNEGSSYTLTLSGAPDTVDNDPLTSWQVTWGDGAVQNVSGNPSSVTHTYLDGPNSYTISASAFDADGSYPTNTLAVTVNNVAPTITQADSLSGQINQTLTFAGAFTDPGILDTHTATVSWGDGSANSTGTVTESGGSGNVTATHAYTTAGTYTITLTVTDKDGGSTQATATATITATTVSATISGASSINEGASYTLSLSCSGGTPTGWTIVWGDGNTQNYNGNPSSETHTYADGPNHVTISATATTSGGSFASNALPVTVNAIAPTVSISGASSINEGTLYTLTLSGTPDSVDADALTSWKITWGDGVVQNVSGNPSSVTHTYLDGPHSYTISAAAVDENGSYSTNTVAVTVNNVAPTVTVANAVAGNEGSSVSFYGAFTDPGVLDTHTASINWGDGTPATSGTVTEYNGSGSVTATHTYAETGSYTITLTVTDNNNGSGSKTATATVANVNPAVTAAADASEVWNQPFTIPVATFSDPGYVSGESYTASINWGDGTPATAGTVNFTLGSAGVATTGTVSGGHTYTTVGNYTVTVTVSDDDTSPASGTAQLIVHSLACAPTKFFVVDQPAHHIFSYDQYGNLSGGFDVAHNNQRGWGIVSNAAMSTLWIVDANKNVQVYVYKPDGTVLGDWIADTVTNASDIATDGASIWLLDTGSNKIDYFAGAAGWTSGHAPPTSSFALNSNDTSPSGMVTDGSTIWVTDNKAQANTVFAYSVAGAFLGSWTLDAADTNPVGITLNPNYTRGSATDLWTVDANSNAVYRYAGASTWTSGSHSATASWPLNSSDGHPQGITDPTITITTPPTNSTYVAGSGYLISGTATATSGTLQQVTVGSQTATVDAAGNFFVAETTEQGTNSQTITATDGGGSASSTVSVTGTAAVVASSLNPTAIDFSLLSDVTASMTVSYGQTSFNHGTSVLYANYTATNSGHYTIGTPLIVGVQHISVPSVRVRQNTGLMADGTPFYDLSSLVSGMTPPVLTPGSALQTGSLAFYDPEGIPFTYTLVFYGRLNHAPRFTSVPVVQVVAGQTYRYTTTAADPEGDYLSFSPVAVPQYMAFTDAHAGTLTWNTSGVAAGNYSVRLRVSDSKGGTADQVFVLTVLPSGTNYPPVFTSTPPVHANVASLYGYQATVSDLDNDSQTFALVSGPTGLTINPGTGLVQWTPSANQVGSQAVTIQDTDAGGLSVQQTFNIWVDQALDNDPPLFVTTPVTSVPAGQFYVYPSQAVDDDHDAISYTLTQAPGSMAIDPSTGQLSWQTTAAEAGQQFPITIQAADGRGATATQSFTLTVTTAAGSPGALQGTVYNDLNDNGQRDWLITPGSQGGPLTLQQAGVPRVPYAMDYDPLINQMVVLGFDGTNSALYRVRADGTELLYASLGALYQTDGTAISIVRPGNTAGFTAGDIFVPGPGGRYVTPTVIKVSNGGTTVQSGWATLSGTTGQVDAVYVDQTGVFGDQLLVLTTSNPGSTITLWLVNSSGTPTQLADLTQAGVDAGPGECSLMTVPNNSGLYGPLAGQVLILSDGEPAVTVSATGTIGHPHGPFTGYNRQGVPQYASTGLDNTEGASLMPAGGTNFFAIADTQSYIAVADGSPLAPYAGQFVSAHETGGTAFTRVWFDGTNLQTATVPLTTSSQNSTPWYEDAFAPIGINPVPDPPLEPGLPSWTVYLDTNNNGHLDTGEPSTTTDVNGHYAFWNLTAGNYTVAEVPQLGWTQTGPIPVPPGTYSVSLASGQTLTGLDFGNLQNPTPPVPPPLTPPTSNPDQPPVFDTTAPTNASVIVGQPFSYPASAHDPDGGVPLVFDLPVHPHGMVVGPHTGLVVWQPTPDQAGTTANVLLRVTDTQGSVALQWFQIAVAATNPPPAIASTPSSTAYTTLPYKYTVLAQDGDGDTLSYSLTAYPTGMTLTGNVVSWTPTSTGQYSATVQVSDGHGGTATQGWNITVLSPSLDHAPTISSTPRQNIALGQTYYYEIVASDPENDPLTYTLTTKPTGMTISGTVVSWTPTASQFGSNSVVLQVSDGRNGTATQSWTIQVTASASNHPPTITSTPSLVGVVGQLYSYNATATDADGDAIGWKLMQAPFGMSVDQDHGTVRWTPQSWQTGNQTVILEAYDPYGAAVAQSFTILVYATNQPPVILSTPPLLAQWKRGYSYAIQATDPDGDGLSYALSDGHGGQALVGGNMTSSGLFTATAQLSGTLTITVTVTDSAGLTATQVYLLNVVTSAINYPPVITSSPTTIAPTGTAYSYQVAVSDPDNDTHTFALSTTYSGSGPPTINSSGLVSWTTPVAGTYQFTVTVTDAGSLTATQTYTLQVGANSIPSITSTAPSTLTLGLPYRYDVQASDTDGDALTYSLSGTLPSGMTIDSYGRITWTPTATGTYSNITVKATDTYGAQASQTFSVTVSADTTAPSVELKLNPTQVAINQQDTILVFGSDNVGVASLTVTLNGANLRLDSAGEAFYTPTSAGNYTIVATAKDAAGNIATSTQTLTVSNPAGTPPTISLTTPGLDANITAPTNLLGTVSDDHVGLSYTVTVLTFDGTPSRLIGSGSTTTSSSLSLNSVTFDPTLLPNGDYTIEVKVTDTDDNLTTTLDRHVSVSANLKLGREQMTVTDLTLPVAGIPITISRTYDSLEADKQFDFGYGWRLSYGDAKLTVDLQPGADVGWGAYPAFLYGTRVYVTMPGGQREGFTFQPYQAAADPFGIFLYWHPYFAPDPGVLDTLSAPDNMLSFDANTGAYYEDTGEGYETYNPADPTFGGTYTVTNTAGLGSTIDATTGKLVSMKAHNGNTLTITANGITSNTGRAVVFTRNPAGEITAITDPRGNSVKFGYDINGNLVSVFDRAGDPGVGYTYDVNHAHYLSGVVDSLGVPQLQVGFDSNGRMTQTTDAKGHVLNLGYNTSTLTQTVTDPSLPAGQQTTTVSFSSRGDMSQAVDPTGAQTTATFNNTQSADVDLPDSVTQVERLTGGGSTNFTTDLSYDSQGDVTGTTNVQTGASTHITYGPFDAVATSSDALGNTTTSTYDNTSGNLLSTTSAAGLITDYGYDSNNNLTSITPIDPNFSFVIKGGALPPAGSTFSYDSFGNLASSTSPTSVTTAFNYDPNGNQTGSSFTWVSGSSQQVVTTGGIFDPNDRQTQSIDQYNHASVTHFNVVGNVAETDDELGNPTTSIFDAANHVIQTTTPDNLITDTVYDPEGRTSYTDDPHVANQADVHGTHTIYDSDGRVVETDRLDNMVIQVSQSNGIWSSTFISAGALLSKTTSQYNDLGQVTQSTDAANQPTVFQYDAAGNQTYVTDALNETTQTLFDLAGRTVGTVDALGHVTQYVLDPDGKTLRTIYADGTYSQMAYDDLGRQSTVTDQMGRTTQYQYDRFGHMNAVVQPAVVDPRSGQLMHPTTQYGYDVYGNLTQILDALQRPTNFTFDAFGHQLSRTLPMQQTETSTFDNYGRAATHTDFKGQQEVSGYDSLGRLNSKTFYAAGSQTAGETISYHFDSWGRNDTVTDTIAGQSPRLTSYGFSLDNQVTSITTPEGTVNYVYDPATGFHTQTWTANSSITYAPDALQRVHTVTVTEQNGVTITPLVTTYYYTPVGTIDHVTYPNGTETDYLYNTLNEVTKVSNVVSGSGAVLSSYAYTLDQSGLRTGVTEKELESDTTTSTVTKTWSYDALERLTQEAVTVSGSVPYSSYTGTYVYDLVGNRLSKTDVQGSTTTVVSSVYNNNDELSSDSATVNGTSSYQSTYGYDANGSQFSIVRTGTGAETDTYGYDLQNRLSTANISRTESGQSVTIVASYTYDDSGTRAQQVVTVNGGSPTTTQYLVDQLNPTGYTQVLEEHTNGAATPSVSYFIGLGVFGQNTGSGTVNYFMSDVQGSTRLVTNVAGAIAAREAYDGYGNLLGVSVGVIYPPVTIILFDAQRFDVVLFRYYMRARVYDPSTGEFTQQDPLLGALRAPSTLPRYYYAAANPVNNADPSGRETLVSFSVGFGIVGGLVGLSYGAVWGLLHGGVGRAVYAAIVGAVVGGLLSAALGAATFSVLSAIRGGGAFSLRLLNEIILPAGGGHSVSHRFFLVGAVLGLVAGFFLQERGLFWFLSAASGYVAADWMYDVSIFLRSLDRVRTVEYTYIRTTAVYGGHFCIGFALGYLFGWFARTAIDKELSVLEQNLPPAVPGDNYF